MSTDPHTPLLTIAPRQLEEAIRHYLDIYNADPRPFAWSKSADEILASLERFCSRVQRVSE